MPHPQYYLPGDKIQAGCPWCLGHVSFVDYSAVHKDGQTWHAKCRDLYDAQQRIARGKTMPLKCQIAGCTSAAREDSDFCFDHRIHHVHARGKTMPNPSTEATDPVNHPKHYTAHPSGVECIQITEHMGFCLGNAVKYIWRADLKNGTEDLRKAIWYLEREIAKREGK